MSPSTVFSSSYFPVEIERLIFRAAAKSHRVTSMQLVVVAQRVKVWVEPILYSMVRLYNLQSMALFLHTIDSRPSAFFATHVKILHLTNVVPVEDAVRILSVCAELEILCSLTTSSASPELFAAISRLPLRRLTIDVGSMANMWQGPEFSLPAFHNITHLHLGGICAQWMMWSSAAWSRLTNLTHLAILYYTIQGVDVVATLQSALGSCMSLQLCLALSPSERALDEILQMLEETMTTDPRLIVHSRDDFTEKTEWEALVTGGADMWERARMYLAERQKALRLRGSFSSIPDPNLSEYSESPTVD